MKIVVIGGSGFIGSKLVAALRRTGHEVVVGAPDSGVNTQTGEGLDNALAGAHAVVDVSNSPVFDDAGVMKFFETAGRNIATAEKTAGVKHHVLLSIVGADHLADSGYLRAKVAQEKLVKDSGIPYTILRSTQFLEFMSRMADLFSDGKTLRVPPVLVQPIASDEVVDALADLVLKPAANAILEVAGPEKIRLDDLIRRVLEKTQDARKIVPDAHARYYGTELNEQSLVPATIPTRIGAVRFEDWLSRNAVPA
jgi:uncharacterized protein YbjT (DUF2867 family)